MGAQENPKGCNHPQTTPRSHLDPEHESRAYPGKWDLSSLPQPAHPLLNGTGQDQEADGLSQQDGAEKCPSSGVYSSSMLQKYAEMQIDPFLDSDKDETVLAPESCRGRQI